MLSVKYLMTVLEEYILQFCFMIGFLTYIYLLNKIVFFMGKSF